MKKKTLVFTLTLLMITVFTQTAFAEETKEKEETKDTESKLDFTDLDDTCWAYDSIVKLVNGGIIDGYDEGTFKPDGDITRAELVKIVNLIYKFTDKPESTKFTDIKSGDWYYDYVLTAEKAGYINGYPDNTFGPNKNITRQELCKIIDSINNLVELPYDGILADDVTPWAEEFVKRVISNRIMMPDSDNNFRATENATRAEVCDALADFLLDEPTEPEDTNPIGGSSGGTGSPGGSDDSDNDDKKQEELYDTMNDVIQRLKSNVIPELTSDDQKEIVNDIINSMEKYKKDNDYDYESAAKDTYKKYKDLSSEEQKKLKYEIELNNPTKDLLDLKDFFFPDVNI